ncbi:MAG: MucB/RseB C-terminal domain-containing protein [Sulfuriflexus sp.]|nr:MucB/RseB C-terminal domain-containing protein [Sulfuriflexus sp.]
MRRVFLISVLLFFNFSLTANAEKIDSDTVREWLGRVTAAGKSLNYEGTFVYRHGNDMEAVKIIHKADDKGEHERMISLTGSAREIIRNNKVVTCILPDSKSVVVDNNTPGTQLPSFPSELDQLDAYYDFSFEGYERVASRETRRVVIKPQDRFRYGYRLWIDDAFELLLRSELLDPDGNAVEQIMFTDIKLYESLDSDLLKPNISGREFTWVTDDETAQDEPVPVDPNWQVKNKPKGFVLAHHNMHKLPETNLPVEHLVYTDGLAWVSVYIEHIAKGSDSLQGATSMGAVNAYGRVMGEYHITAVGEVPATTVELLSSSVIHTK